MDKLFTPVKEAHDPKNRIVFVNKTDTGFSVSKPRTGFQSKEWPKEDDPELVACFERQRHCGHNHASYLPAERAVEVAAAADETTANVKNAAKKPATKNRAAKPAAKKSAKKPVKS